MEDASGPVSLDGGTFGFTLPMTLGSWLGFLLGGLVTIGSSFFLLTGSSPYCGFIAAVGCMMSLMSSPTPLHKEIRRLRFVANRDRLAASWEEQSDDYTNFWTGHSVQTRGESSRDWVLPAPLPEAWNREDIHAPDPSGLLPEHPTAMGTPQSSTFTNWSLFIPAAGIFTMLSIWMVQPFLEYDPMIIWVTFTVLCLFWTAFGYFAGDRNTDIQDTPTSLVRSAAVGPLELVGQIRPGPRGALNVTVDRDPAKRVNDLIAYTWLYEVRICRQETYTDSEGNTRTREKCYWQTIRRDEGVTDFILHDGTGGMKVLVGGFGQREYDAPIKVWECPHSPRARDLLYELFTDGDVRAHRWSISGLRLDDPVYVLGVAQSREEADLEEHGIDRTVAHALLEVVGESALGKTARIERGTELTAIAGARSQFELVLIPLIFSILGGLLTFAN